MKKIAFSSDPVNTFEEHPRESSIPPIIDAFLNSSNFGEGYVVLSRSSLHSEVFQDKDPFYWKAWTWMLMKANHARVERNGFVYERGEFYTCLEEIVSSLCFHRRRKLIKPTLKQIRYMMDWLVRQRMIEKPPVDRSDKLTIDSHSTHKRGSRGAYLGLRIRIVNWDSYQNPYNYMGRHRGTGGAEVGHYNNNEKNENNEFEECKEKRDGSNEPPLIFTIPDEKCLKAYPNEEIRPVKREQVREFITWFGVKREEKKRMKYVARVIDYRLVTRMLSIFPLDDLQKCVIELFSEYDYDRWLKKSECDIAVFFSQINRLMSKLTDRPMDADEYGKWGGSWDGDEEEEDEEEAYE